MSTKSTIGDQVHRMLSAGDPSLASKFDERELWELISQACNARLKVDHFQTKMQYGDTIPEGSTLASYEVDVAEYQSYSKCTLPATPISLPMNMGLFHVGPADDIFCQYIPCQPGQWAMLKGQGIGSDLLGQVFFEPSGMEVVFTKNLIALNVNKVLVRLIIADISAMDEHKTLPIPADMEFDIVQDVVKILSSRGTPDKVVESITSKP